MIKNTGGAAFPRVGGPGSITAYPHEVHQTGMTLRDYLAAKALQGMLTNSTEGGNELEYAVTAYRFADAMLEARKQ